VGEFVEDGEDFCFEAELLGVFASALDAGREELVPGVEF